MLQLIRSGWGSTNRLKCELSHEERKMKTGVEGLAWSYWCSAEILRGELLLCLLGKPRDFKMFQCLSCPPVSGSSQYLQYLLIIFALWPYDLNENILCFLCPTLNDQGLTLIEGPFEIKHFFLRRTKGACKEVHSRPPTQGRALPLLSWRAVTASSSVGLSLQIRCWCSMLHISLFAGPPLVQQLAMVEQNGHGQSGLQLQAEETQRKASSALHFLSLAKYSELRSALPRVCFSIFGFHILSEYTMQWALGFKCYFKSSRYPPPCSSEDWAMLLCSVKGIVLLLYCRALK